LAFAILAWLCFAFAAFCALGCPPPGIAGESARARGDMVIFTVLSVSTLSGAMSITFAARGFISGARWLGGAVIALGAAPFLLSATALIARLTHR
jgi:hypothetical protein